MRHTRAIQVSLLPVLLVVLGIVGCKKPVEQSNRMPSPSTTVPSTTVPSMTDPMDDEVDVAVESPAPQPQVAGLVPIDLDLPVPAFRGTPVPMEVPNVEKPRGKPREPFLAPEGTVNLSRGKPTHGSDPAPVAGEYDYVTDGDKEASDFGYVELRPGSQWVQVDLGRKSTIYAVLAWHSHAEARVYNDVIVQVSDDPDFLDAATVFNNDYDNSSGQGIGQDMGYVETSEGKLIDCQGREGRYVRLYCNGSHIDVKNHYTEVEVYGKPAA